MIVGAALLAARIVLRTIVGVLGIAGVRGHVPPHSSCGQFPLVNRVPGKPSEVMGKHLKNSRGRADQPAAPRRTVVRWALMGWFRTHARDLPWRQTQDPYAIWISEVMLQQTQIATVIPYYERFLSAFPTIRSLARAPLERVLELWSGLGYYRRARYLHEAAQVLVAKYDGRFPEDYASLRSLAGIGDYTARAILSIAFRQPYAVLDGNVARVVARLIGRRGNLHETKFRRAVEGELAELLSRRHPGDFNQALMELGQTLCMPRTPHCPECPLARWCRAHRAGDPEAFPAPRPRRPAESRHLAVALLRMGSRVAMVRGLDDGLLPDIWNFPAALGATSAQARSRLEEKLHGLTRAPFSFAPPVAKFHHSITFRSIRALVYPVKGVRTSARGEWRCFEISRLPQAAISQVARKVLESIRPVAPGLTS